MHYIIIMHKFKTKKGRHTFLSRNGKNTTPNPFLAKVFSEESIIVEKRWINNGETHSAVPITSDAFEALGFRSNFDFIALERFLTFNINKR